MPLSVGVAAENIVRRDGQGRVALEVCRALAASGHKVIAFASKIAPELEGVVDHSVVDSGTGPQLFRSMRFAARGEKAIEGADPDVVFTLGSCVVPSSVRSVYYAAFTHAGWRVLQDVTGVKPDMYHRMHHAWVLRRERRGLASASAVIVMSKRMVDEVSSLAPSARSTVVPGGVDASEYEQVPAMRAAAREALGVGDAFVVSVIGEYATGRKGVHVLAEAMRDAPDELLIVHGSGPGSFRSRISADTNASFPDPALPVEKVMAASDVVAIPSLYEPFSLVALEAAASGIPVVITDVAGAAEQLSPHGAAKVVPPNDPAALRTAIDSIKHAPEEARPMTERARQVALRLSWRSVTRRIVDVIEHEAS